jgi:hypothetical protein
MSHLPRWLPRGSDSARCPDTHRHLPPPPDDSQSVWCISGLPDFSPWSIACDRDCAGGAEPTPQGQARCSCLVNLSRKKHLPHHR